MIKISKDTLSNSAEETLKISKDTLSNSAEETLKISKDTLSNSAEEKNSGSYKRTCRTCHSV